MLLRFTKWMIVVACTLGCGASADDLGGDSIEFQCVGGLVAGTTVRSLSLVFERTHPSTQAVEAALRRFLETSASIYTGMDIRATAWFSPTGKEADATPLPVTDRSTSLYYLTATRKIVTDNEARGACSTMTADAGRNFATRYEEKELPQSTDREGSLDVVFSSAPQEMQIYLTLAAQLRRTIREQKPKVRITARAFTGVLGEPSNMKPIAGSDGMNITVEWDPANHKIVRKNLKAGSVQELGIE